MAKRIFIIHRWAGSPNADWYPWLKSELESKKFEVHVLEMPHPENPTIDDWINHLAESVNTLDNKTFFIGHSIGCQTIMRYLEKQNHACGGAVFIAGRFTLQGLETEEEQKIAQPWLETQIDFDKVKQNLPKSVAIFSDNDPFVSVSDKEIFRAKLNSHIIIEHSKGHFTSDDGITELPATLKSMLNMAN